MGSLETPFPVVGVRGRGRDIDRERPMMMGSDGRRFQRDGSAGPMPSEIPTFHVLGVFRDCAGLARRRDGSPSGENDGGTGSVRKRLDIADDGEADRV